MPLRFALPIVVVGLLFSAVCSAEVTGNPTNGKTKAAVCAGCHGLDGNGGADPSWPKLAGQFPEYLVTQLKAFKSGARKNPIMSGMAAPLSDQDMSDLAAYFGSLNVKQGAATNKDAALTGEQLYRGGNAQKGVPACMSCHGPAGHGVPPRFPRVTGQNAAYTEKQLLDFKAKRRVDNGAVMTAVAAGLVDDEIKAVSEYMAGLH